MEMEMQAKTYLENLVTIKGEGAAGNWLHREKQE